MTATPTLDRETKLLGDFDAGRNAALARVVSIVENHRAGFDRLLARMQPRIGRTRRIGITGPPGAGKSTLTTGLARAYREAGMTVGIVAVDPTSPFTGGALLGDRVRMESVALDPGVFIRSMATRGSLGGLAASTREVADVLDAFGFDRVLIETVGVGQSETAVHAMSDFFLLLMLPGAGDELQGMKRGIIEMIDGMAINKADGDNIARAERARAEYASALHLFPPSPDGWMPRVVCCSALNDTGIDEIWQMVLEQEKRLTATDKLQERRSDGDLQWMRELVLTGLGENFRSHPAVAELMPKLERDVREGRVTPLAASRELLRLFHPATPESHDR